MKKLYFFIVAALAVAFVSCKKAGSVFETEQYTHQETYFLTDNKTDSLDIDLYVELPTKMDNADLLKTMQENLQEAVFGEQFRMMTADEAVEAYSQMLKQEYVDDNAGLEDMLVEDPGSFCAEEYLNGRLMNIQRGIISYGVERYVYSGGVHGMNAREFFNYDAKTGDLLTQDDIFADGYEEPLTHLIISKILEQVGVADKAALANEGYYVEEIVPNYNFYLDEEALVFVYNAYEIAPYSYGETVVELAWSEIESLLKPISE